MLTHNSFSTQSTLLTTLLPALSLTNTLAFLLHGKYPTLLHRILRIRLAPLRGARHAARDISFEYLNRQLVWHAFTEFLLFLLPLVGVSRWRRWIGRAWRKMALQLRRMVGGGKANGETASQGGKLAALPERTCGICWEEQSTVPVDGGAMVGAGGGAGGVVGSSETDVTNPYEAVPCGCVYCYVCLAGKLEEGEGEGWVCLRCGELVREGRVWRGDVVERLEGGVGEEDAVTALDEGDEGGAERKGDATAPFKTEWARDESDSGVDVTNG
ncbi:MAG: peroxisome assembly protein (Peroxin-2) [Ramalina farinacea]|uniref:Peroxisome assembly protein (Peroxin-2) n=1 Tax=Ramalina farinacea TaxID=258253 RepID=A0AA43QP77_9LECA|nr:peroxisome assembly protein (Peroxin-2) [Ramalina farinacea]